MDAVVLQEFEDVGALSFRQGGQEDRGGIDEGDGAGFAGGPGAEIQAHGDFQPGVAGSGDEHVRGGGAFEIGGEFRADALGIPERGQAVKVVGGDCRRRGAGDGAGRDEQVAVRDVFAAGRDGRRIEIDGFHRGPAEFNVGRQEVAQGALNDLIGHPASGQIGQGGQHGRDRRGVEQEDVSRAGAQGPDGLKTGKTAADDDCFFLHDPPTYCKMGPMQDLRKEFERHWRRCVDELFAVDAAGEEAPSWQQEVRAALLAPGKRLRPLLFARACRGFGAEPFPDWMPAALALELAHNFILVHDDLMDRSERRRGAATLPARLEARLAGRPAGGFRGRDLALVAGDLLYTLAMDSLLQTQAPPRHVTQAMQAFMNAARDTGRGAWREVQAAQAGPDRLTTAEIEDIYALKTGRYTFELPLRLAAIFTGTDRGLPFGRFGVHGGIAYQLRNDREGLTAWLAGGPVPDDLRDGRPIWAVVHAWQAADPAGRAALAGEPNAEYRNVLQSTGALEAMEDAIRRHVREALACCEGCGLEAFMRGMLPADTPGTVTA